MDLNLLLENLLEDNRLEGQVGMIEAEGMNEHNEINTKFIIL